MGHSHAEQDDQSAPSREIALESVERAIADRFAAWRRSALIEAWTPIVIGLLLMPVIYLVLWFFFWAATWRLTHGRIELAGALSPIPLSVGVVWMLLGFIVAWRHVGPFSDPEPLPGKPYDRFLDPPLMRVNRGDIDMSEPGSVLNADSLAAIFATGPRHVLDGVASLRELPRIDSDAFRRAAEILVQAASTDGLTPKSFLRDERSAQAMGILWRLKLIRKDGTFVERWRMRTTKAGDELSHA